MKTYKEILTEGIFDRFKKNNKPKVNIKIGDYVNTITKQWKKRVGKVIKIAGDVIYVEMNMEGNVDVLKHKEIESIYTGKYKFGQVVKERGSGLVAVGRVYSIWDKEIEVYWNTGTYKMIDPKRIKIG